VHNVEVALEGLIRAGIPIRTAAVPAGTSMAKTSAVSLRERLAARARRSTSSTLVIKPEDVVDGHR